jgi:hypothetical protein
MVRRGFKMTDKITLPWADEFRNLCKKHNNNYESIIYGFKFYIEQKEKEINKRWNKVGDMDGERSYKDKF